MKGKNFRKIYDDNSDDYKVKLKKYIETAKQGILPLPYLLDDLMKKYNKSASQTYHDAMLDRQIYSKMINYANPQRGSKRTLLQVAVSLGTNITEATILLASCGYAFNPLSTEDSIFRFAIENSMSMTDTFEQIAVIPMDEKLYCVLKPITHIEGVGNDEAIVFVVHEEDGKEPALMVETDELIALKVFEEYYQLLDESNDADEKDEEDDE